MLLFDDSKKLEKALGEEAAAVIAHVFEKVDEKWRQELATRADLQEMRNDIIERIADANSRIAGLDSRFAGVKHEILKWMIGISIAQLALLVGILALLK